MLEKLMEDLVVQHYTHILGSKFTLLYRQHKVGPYRFDLVFKTDGPKEAHLIVELQSGCLDREHTYKVLDYLDEYRAHNPGVNVQVCVIANQIPDSRRKKLRDRKIYFKEVTEVAFEMLRAGVRPDIALTRPDPSIPSDVKVLIDPPLRNLLTLSMAKNPGRSIADILSQAIVRGL